MDTRNLPHLPRLSGAGACRKRITVMEWPAQSPDLNPIEALWDHFKRMVLAQNPTNVKELTATIKVALQGFPLNKLIDSINSMCRRFKSGIKAREGPTKY